MSLVRRLIGAGPWVQWLPVAAIAGVFSWSVATTKSVTTPRDQFMRMGLLVVAMGMTFVFDDAAAVTAAATPSRLWLRRVLRVGLALLPWVALTGILLWAGGQELTVVVQSLGGGEPEIVTLPSIPAQRMALEATGMAALGLAIAALIGRRWDDVPGKFASPGLLGLFAASMALPARWQPWADPYGDAWLRVQPWWWAALALGVLIVAIVSWDTRTR